MLSLRSARRLREAGLVWHPTEGDRFVLPDRDLDQVFTISEMVVEVRRAAGAEVIAFNGTTEWALDSIEQTEAVWLPREEQLRQVLGEAFLALRRADDGWRCTVRAGGAIVEVAASEASEAYAEAILAILR
jgi:hypothetical protein